ncbi:bifunctional folylpolyglutamate synthase/dihydrofolate synthase [Algihabitans albus]|uniref:bifunctional folylpolyglutamate synthase/dihydrofolate synthase n=1 Tax=Algihabitans albus TaxID=2164067 RepID=UPI000E5CB439|nr:folylpolyglutamate synthase/dihydrofolate synthase family protein [Algihabitans albus]
MSQSSDAVLERLTRLHPKIIDLSLGRIERLLSRLGRPDRRLPPVVHVAGTNGKGSVIALLRAMLEADGQRVHVYTSPHLVRFHERIRLAGEPVPETDLLALLEICEAANGEASITFFEITTAAAFLAFAQSPADVLLLEVGLGGRLDATNVIARPALTAITPVSMDHMQYLGETLPEIALEKAGILKPDVTAVIARQRPEAAAVIAARAAEVGAPLLRRDQEWEVVPQADGFRLRDGAETLQLPHPALIGAHQLDNAGQAAVLARRLGLPATAIAAGLRSVRWPARLQHLTTGPLVAALPQGWQLWLDGGHNAQAGEMLAAEAAGWSDPLDLVYGMLNTKAAADFLRPLAGSVRRLRAVAIPGEANSLSAEEAAAHARACGIAAAPAGDLEQAVAELMASAERPARILICGSLYLAGKVLAEHG